MKVFTGNSNPLLADSIADSLGQDIGKIEITQFSDGELNIAFLENIRNEDVYIIQSLNSPAENIMELLLMLDAAKRASAKNVVAVIPYLGYGRQDRKDRPRVPISARLMLDLMTAVGVNRIICMDLHSPQIQGFVNVPFDHLYSRITILDRLKKMNLNEENGVILAPDVGGAKMGQSYAKKLQLGFALIDKRRPKPNQTEVVNLVGNLSNKHVIIIDDMIDTGGTICNAAETAIQNGAIDVTVVATHPVLSGQSVNKLQESSIKKVIVCDTIKLNDDQKFEKLEIVSTADVFAESIRRIDSGESLSSMFKI
jgi:ribose-phosphate pyrophosphokinase